mmetsp:Transcript_27441/g.85107  ORF Transcript_27441/g.85107 Transcript_27441/m.85107 type:complete len:185 (-) Transcript_27441:59-613(-)
MFSVFFDNIADPDTALIAVYATQKAIRIVPAAASEAVRSDLPPILAGAISFWRRDPAVATAAALCIGAMTESCASNDVPACASGDVLEEMDRVVRFAHDNAVVSAVLKAMAAIAARAAATFAARTRAHVPRLEGSLAVLYRKAIGAEYTQSNTSGVEDDGTLSRLSLPEQETVRHLSLLLHVLR